MSIFIQASMLSRVDRVAREQNMSKEEARMTIDKVPGARELRQRPGTHLPLRHTQLPTRALHGRNHGGRCRRDHPDLYPQHGGLNLWLLKQHIRTTKKEHARAPFSVLLNPDYLAGG
ncbi:MAG: hypothetical protein J6T19_02295 [Paludibacteraceae bacterium]|nr:hypothetical protein [Paludibacteraceae bacterium]